MATESNRNVGNYQTANTLRALALIAERPYTTPQLAKALDVGDRAARRLVQRLHLDRFIEPDPMEHHPTYRLSEEAFELAFVLLRSATRRVMEAAAAEPVVPTIGEHLRAYRMSRGLSQPAFASRVRGLTLFELGLIERGTETLGLDQLIGIADALGESPIPDLDL